MKECYKNWMRKPISLDLRERILTCYDNEDGTRDQVAKRFCVSVGMVKKLLQQRKHCGEIRVRYYRCGRNALIVESHRKEMGNLLVKKPDMTLKEIRESLGLECTLPAIHYVLHDMGLTYKKRHSAPASKAARISLKHAKTGLKNKKH
jgi:transposase